jgi:uncharacterized protein (DUF433 family)
MQKLKTRKSGTRRPKNPVIQNDLLNRITINPKVLVGKPTIRGMRISVEQILNLLGQGMTHKEILREFPTLEDEDITAAIQYAHRSLAIEKVYPTGTAG